MASLPPDRGGVRTEARHPGSFDLDVLDTAACVRLLAEDHRAVAGAVAAAAGALAALIDGLAGRMRAGGRLIYVGAGTSGRLGVLDAAECPPTFQSDPGQVVGVIAGGDAALRRSSEGREDDPRGAAEALGAIGLGPRDTVVAIAAGATTPYVLGAIEIAAAAGAATALLACAPPPRPVACDHLVVLDTGPEVLAGSTRLKAGSATKLALNAISTAVFVRLGKVYSNLMVDLRATNDKLADRAIRIVQALAPELSRGDAALLLDRAGGSVKAAVVMERRGCGPEEAQRLLDAHHGMLRAVLALPPGPASGTGASARRSPRG
jgi:N-acetylmuramic acid 6-phosphate etherase